MSSHILMRPSATKMASHVLMRPSAANDIPGCHDIPGWVRGGEGRDGRKGAMSLLQDVNTLGCQYSRDVSTPGCQYSGMSLLVSGDVITLGCHY